MATKKASPSWRDVKVKLIDFDRDDLLGLVQDLYVGADPPLAQVPGFA